MTAKDSKEWCVPAWAESTFRQCFQRLDDETRFLHLTMHGLDSVRPELRAEVRRLNQELDGERSSHRRAQRAGQEAAKDADWIEREIGDGYPLLHCHSVVAIWSALEVMVEDLAVAWLTNRTEAWGCKQVQDLKLPLAKYHLLNPEERGRLVVSELGRSLGSALKLGMGQLDALLDVFGVKPAVGSELRRALKELSQVRNVIVHCGAVVDKKLVSECPWVPWVVGERVQISHRLYGWYFRAAERYAERVENQILLEYGGKGCTCPGMDTVEPRPDAEARPRLRAARAK